MFPLNVDPLTRQRQALARVYALLIRVANNENSTARPENFAKETEQAVSERLTPEGVNHEYCNPKSQTAS